MQFDQSANNSVSSVCSFFKITFVPAIVRRVNSFLNHLQSRSILRYLLWPRNNQSCIFNTKTPSSLPRFFTVGILFLSKYYSYLSRPRSIFPVGALETPLSRNTYHFIQHITDIKHWVDKKKYSREGEVRC